MTDGERIIVRKLHLEGMGSRKIAQSTGLSENTVKSFLRRKSSFLEEKVPEEVPELSASQEIHIPAPEISRVEAETDQEPAVSQEIHTPALENCREEAAADLEIADNHEMPVSVPEICREDTVTDMDPSASKEIPAEEPEIGQEETVAEQESATQVIPFTVTEIIQEETAVSGEQENRESGSVGFCLQCGTPITQLSGRKQRRFCSAKCRKKYWRHHPELSKSKSDHICPACGRAFSICGNTPQKYCSRECYLSSRGRGNFRIPGGAL